LEDHVGMGLYFLDVDLNTDMNGVELADRIRALDPNGQIVFVTSHADHMSLTFEYAIGALGYVLKTNRILMKVKITEYIKVVADRFLKPTATERLTIQIDSKVVTVPYRDIMFFEVLGKRSGKVVMYGRTRQEEFRGSLSELEAVSDKFVRVSRTVLVNMDNVTQADPTTGQVHLSSGDWVEASRNGMRHLKQRLGECL